MELTGSEAASDAPYFFLSYAHMPRPVGDDGADPNLWIEQLYKDLSRRVRDLATAPPSRIGFMDSGIRHGTEWARTLSEQLAVCKTFVPLYSPHYFLSENCGKEWHAFCGRVTNGHAKGTRHIQQVIPAQWIPVPLEKRPNVVQRIQFRAEDLGPVYAEHGFYPLTHMGVFKNDYDFAVYELARKIVNAAQGEPAPPGPALDYALLPNAFAGGDGRAMSGDKPFDIVIAALHLADLPDGRARDYYASDVSGWNPYVPDLVEPLAQYARKVAQYCGHRRPRVFSLLDYQNELLRSQDEQASAPAVLLIDPWVVTQPDCRRLLEAYDKMTKPWIQFIIAWSARDAAAAQAQNSPRALLRTVLKNKLGDGGRPARQVASIGVPTIEEMQAVLPSMIRTAGRHFVRLPNPPPAAGLARS